MGFGSRKRRPRLSASPEWSRGALSWLLITGLLGLGLLLICARGASAVPCKASPQCHKPPPPANVEPPSISGNQEPGQQLTASAGGPPERPACRVKRGPATALRVPPHGDVSTGYRLQIRSSS